VKAVFPIFREQGEATTGETPHPATILFLSSLTSVKASTCSLKDFLVIV